jgi:Lon protease-like protein
VSEEAQIPGNFQGTVRLFPLPNVVLFPRVTLPLHIFEPRYRAMTADALAGDNLLTMTLLKPGWEDQYEARPPLYPIGCVGKIIADQKLEDGRYNLLLRGISRVRIIEEVRLDQIYRSARVELLCDTDLTAARDVRKLRRRLAQYARKWFGDMGVSFDQVSRLFEGSLPLGTVSDVLSFVLPLAAELKQELLEQLNIEQRVSRLLEILGEKEPPPVQASARTFPPEFSAN